MPLLDRVRRSEPRAFEYECRRCHAVFLSVPDDAVTCPQCNSTDVDAFVP